MTSVLVTTTPAVPLWPVLGTLTPRSAGLLRTASGVSPCGTDQSRSPLSRLMLTMTTYGGLTIGTPCTTVPPPNPPSAPPPPAPPAPRPPPAAAPRPPAAPRPSAAAPAAGGAVGGAAGGAAPRCGASAALPSPPPVIG